LPVLIKKFSELIKVSSLCETNGGVHGAILHDLVSSIYRLWTDLQKPRFGFLPTQRPTGHVIQMEAV
jgi:hypothetical protein